MDDREYRERERYRREGVQNPAQARPVVRRSPRGYKRSDHRIWEDVCDALTDSDYIDPSDIEVRVEKGEVILSGEVNSRDEKRIAEDIAAFVRGVDDVRNEIRVRRAEEKKRAA